MLPWLGLALLSASWLFSTGFYHEPDMIVWGIAIVAGTVLLTGLAGRMPARRESAIGLVLSVPAMLLAPWPYRIAPVLIVAGLALHLIRWRFGWHKPVARGVFVAGCVLLAQGLAMFVYASCTARSHELPAPLPRAIGMFAGWLGIDVAVHETTLATFSMRKTHLLGATWELLLDPATWCFAVGATCLVAWRYWSGWSPADRKRRPMVFIGRLWLLLALWLPIRAALFMAIYVNDVLRVDYEAPLDAMQLFWSSWLHVVFLAGPVLLCWRFCDPGPESAREPPAPEQATRRPLVAILLVGTAAACLTGALFWDPVGHRQAGRVLVEEYHPQPDKVWERTDKPYDAEWYGHLSGYNYYCIYDYLSRFYETSRLTVPVSSPALSDCDVLMIKVPTRAFSDQEIEAIRRFVEQGGGLLLIGEHTNVFGTGAYLNPIAEAFGFRFRYDCLFGIDSVFEQQYRRPAVPHPIVQHMPPLDFATSCSIEPLSLAGRAVIFDTGLKNAMADYHVDNFYPQPEDDAEMRYGAFVQLWAARCGRGRVVGFADSTIFSNFSTFEPGKLELMMGMVEWLNHRSRLADPRPWLGSLGLLLFGVGLWMARAWDSAWIVLLGSASLGWAVSGVAICEANRAAMPPPEPVRPLVRVVMDRTVCSSRLPRNGFISGQEDEFGIFERWILRLGYFTARRQGSRIFDADLVVFAYPDQPLRNAFVDELVAYVEGGGKALIIDSPENANSTANRLLEPFGLTMRHAPGGGGVVTPLRDWPAVPVPAACSVEGGRPFARLNRRAVAASTRHGKGTVTVVGFGSRFTDAKMGVTGDVVPNEELKRVFDLQFNLLRALVEDESLEGPATDEAATSPAAETDNNTEAPPNGG